MKAKDGRFGLSPIGRGQDMPERRGRRNFAMPPTHGVDADEHEFRRPQRDASLVASEPAFAAREKPKNPDQREVHFEAISNQSPQCSCFVLMSRILEIPEDYPSENQNEWTSSGGRRRSRKSGSARAGRQRALGGF
ncbi:MAG: hypothetical protein JO234_12510 [Hyphomicrobiales bacterium]|nr:hypothetical protein [Hyphomicrobiales bacterium]